jgi:hypothetical protein
MISRRRAIGRRSQQQVSSSAKAEDPVRRGFSVQSQRSLEYWVPACAGTTIEYETMFSRPTSSPSYSISSSLSEGREQGMPGARCTRVPVCAACATKTAHEHTGER